MVATTSIKTVSNEYAQLVDTLRSVNEIHKKRLWNSEKSLINYCELSDERIKTLLKLIDTHNSLDNESHKETIRDLIFNDYLGIDINTGLDKDNKINMDELKFTLEFYSDNP